MNVLDLAFKIIKKDKFKKLLISNHKKVKLITINILKRQSLKPT
jgi:hypothetical protein